MCKIAQVVVIVTNKDVEYPIKLEIKNVKSDRHISCISNRVWGGIQSCNLYELNFMLEHSQVPDTITMKIDEDGTDSELSRSSKNILIRENQATVYLNLDTLIALQKWLNDQVKQLQDLKLIKAIE